MKTNIPVSSADHPTRALRASHVLSIPLSDASDASETTPPEWVELIPAGAFSGRDGRGPYELNIGAVLAAFERGGIDLPIDYDHQSLEADAKAGPVPAAGWIKAIEARDGALWGRVQWTPRAAELIAQKEYRYLSPVFRHDKQGRVLALEGAGLTHYPNLYLSPVAHTQGAAAMNLKPIAEALGVEGEADVASLTAHAARLKEAATRQPDPAQWVPMSQHKAVAEELAALQKQIAEEKAEAAVTAAHERGQAGPGHEGVGDRLRQARPGGVCCLRAAGAGDHLRRQAGCHYRRSECGHAHRGGAHRLLSAGHERGGVRRPQEGDRP